MELTATALPGCYLVQCDVIQDERGYFVKTYHRARVRELGLRTDWREEYYSVSARDVLRGMHFQLPPAEHAKLVHCIAGEVLDVAVDLRRGSPMFGKCASFCLSGKGGQSVYIPAGLAHGFLSITNDSMMHYEVTSVHSPGEDAGVLWNSLPFDWPIQEPVLSGRDRLHPRLEDFDTPFVYGEDG
jgi:dTDP-4-dehydrorhamnose 3,5-epimerase